MANNIWAMSESARRYSVAFIYAALTLGTVLVYWQVRDFDFVDYDDKYYIYENQDVRNGLSWDGLKSAFVSAPAGGNWLPLTWLSLMLDCQLFGVEPGPMHLVNLLLHLANTLLLFAVLRRMTGAVWPSAFVAATFALHPMHVESVAWITERKDVLSALFLILTMAAYTAYVRRGGLSRYFLAVILFALGLMAKPMLVTLPLVLLLLDYWPLDRLSSKSVVEKIPFFALAAASSMITLVAQRSGGSIVDAAVWPLRYRVGNCLWSYASYIGRALWPRDMAVMYPFDAARLVLWKVAISGLLLLGISILVIRFGRSRRYLPVGWFWFVVTLIPVIGLIQSGAQSMADRYTYIPYIGLFIMIAWGLPQLLSRWPQRRIALAISAGLALTALGICAHKQTGHWRDSIALWSRLIEVTPQKYMGYTNRAVAQSRLGRTDEAIEDYRKAISIEPLGADARYNLANIQRRRGLWYEAIDLLDQVIEIDPNYAEAYNNLGVIYSELGLWQEAKDAYKRCMELMPHRAETYYNLGSACAGLGCWQEAADAFTRAAAIRPDYPEALRYLGVVRAELDRWQGVLAQCDQAVKARPDSAEAHNALGAAYGNLGRGTEAVESFRKALEIDPDHAGAHQNLAVELAAMGRYDEAADRYRAAIMSRPDWPAPMNNLAWLIAASPSLASRDLNEALRLAIGACELAGYRDPASLDTLAGVYASLGRFTEAVDTANKALSLIDAAGQPRFRNIIIYHRSFYMQGKPYIEQAPGPLSDPKRP